MKYKGIPDVEFANEVCIKVFVELLFNTEKEVVINLIRNQLLYRGDSGSQIKEFLHNMILNLKYEKEE